MKDNNVIDLSAFGPLPKTEIKTIKIGEAEIEVIPYIPYEDVFDMIQWSIDFIADARPFISEPIKRLISDFAILKYYTNINTEFINPQTPISDIYADYDLVQTFNVIQIVKQNIDQTQLNFYFECLEKTLASIVVYTNSAMGLVDNLVLNAKENSEILEGLSKVIDNDSSVNKMVNLINAADMIRSPKIGADE